MSRQHSWSSLIKETAILTGAVAHHCRGCLLFFLLPSHASVSSISGLGIVLSNFIPLPLSRHYHDLKRGAPHHRLLYLWKRIWGQTVYTSIMLPLFLGLFEKVFPNIGSLTRQPGAGCALLHPGRQHRLKHPV